MARAFKSRLKKFVDVKEKELGFRMTQQQIAKVTGIPQPTISVWLQEDKHFRYVDVNVAGAFIEFFNCTLDDLLEIVHE